jgi:hypothetical protein
LEENSGREREVSPLAIAKKSFLKSWQLLSYSINIPCYKECFILLKFPINKMAL